MKGGGFAPGGFAQSLERQGQMAQEARARALAQHQQELRYRDGEAFVEDFQTHLGGPTVASDVLRPEVNGFVDDFERFSLGGHQPGPLPTLDMAFASYLSGGTMDVAYLSETVPQGVIMNRARAHVASSIPGLPPAAVEQRAVEMVHNLELDLCRGRPHPSGEWAEDFHSQGAWHDEMLDLHGGPLMHHHHSLESAYADQHRHNQHHPLEWKREMDMHHAFDVAQTGTQWASQYNERDFAQLDKAYEAEQWAEEHRRDEEAAATKQQVDDPWFDEFLQRENELKEKSLKQITARLTAIDDPKLQQSQFMRFVRDLDSGRAVIDGDTLVRQNDEWAEEAKRLMAQNEESEVDFLERMYQDPEFDHAGFDWAGLGGNFTIEPAGYRFEQSAEANPYTDEADPMERGVELFEQGRFSDAILAFEAVVMKNERHAAAWHYLGKCHQEGDKDGQAIAALTKATEMDPSHLQAFVDLAVSHTNNMQKDRAMAALEGWLQNNPRYAQFAPPPIDHSGRDVEMQLRALYDRQDTLIDSFVCAAQTSPDSVDPAVQICLGLLYSLALEYDNAAQCFSAALTKLPEDYALWNKLGATLANSGRSEEALQAYFQALERKPLYVRARANLGISFMAMKLYPEAAKQFLSALSIEPDATHIWSNLETVFSYLQRNDLLVKARARRVADFRGDFDF